MKRLGKVEPKSKAHLKEALELQKRHKLIRKKQGISPALRATIKELSHPDAFKKHFKRDDDDQND